MKTPPTAFGEGTIRRLSDRLCFGRRSQRDGRLGGEQQEREGFLQIKPDRIIGVAQVADRDVLAEVQLEIAATRGHYKSSVYCRRPNDFIVDQALDVLQHRVTLIAGFSQCGMGLGSK